jgi:hypothetical protein
MKGESTLKNFEERLKELTSAEPSIWFISPYQRSGRPFCGTFDDSSFNLTRNSIWNHVKWISIDGTFKKSDDGTTEVDYEIGTTRRMKAFSIIFFAFTLIGINIFLFNYKDSLANSAIIALNGFWLFAFLWWQLVNRITRKIVEERFQTEFNIEHRNKGKTHAIRSTTQ